MRDPSLSSLLSKGKVLPGTFKFCRKFSVPLLCLGTGRLLSLRRQKTQDKEGSSSCFCDNDQTWCCVITLPLPSPLLPEKIFSLASDRGLFQGTGKALFGSGYRWTVASD